MTTQSIQGVFAERVRETPDAVAVSAPDGELTYAAPSTPNAPQRRW